MSALSNAASVGALALRLNVPISRAAAGPNRLTSIVVNFGSLTSSAVFFHMASDGSLSQRVKLVHDRPHVGFYVPLYVRCRYFLPRSALAVTRPTNAAYCEIRQTADSPRGLPKSTKNHPHGLRTSHSSDGLIGSFVPVERHAQLVSMRAPSVVKATPLGCCIALTKKYPPVPTMTIARHASKNARIINPPN